MAKTIASNQEALSALLAGVNLIANAVKSTLGPSGRNCVYERAGTNLPISTRDGVTVAAQIEHPDPLSNIGVNLIKGVANEAVDSSGDGTTTASLLAQTIFSEGVKAILAETNPVVIKRGIEAASARVIESLRAAATPVEKTTLVSVATISANNDKFLGGLIAEAVERSGDDGIVTVEISRSPDSSLVMVDGMQFGTGYLAPEFVNNPEKNECLLENVSILLYEGKLTHVANPPTNNCMDLLRGLATEGRSLLVIAEDVTDEALAVLSLSAKNGPLRCVAVKTPGGVEHLHDLAALVGGRVITALSDTKIKDLKFEDLGHAKKVIVKAQTTTVIADGGENPALNRRLAELRTQVTEATTEASRLRLQSRLARLAGGIAIIRVGAATELEMNERKDRIEDAMHATRCAVKEGVVPGGGVALARAGAELPTRHDELSVGTEIVRKACFAPIRTLAENGGEPADLVLKTVLAGQNDFGWNARTHRYGPLMAAGVIDPLKVVRTAFESASSVAALMLITSTLVANERK